MANSSLSPMSRRGLLRLSIVVGMLGAVGCSEDETAKKVETSPVEGGGRSRLGKMEEKAKDAVAKKK
jgi:hypothetical protein